MWKKRNEYYLECDGWTITKSTDKRSLYPYGLWQGNKNYGHFETADEAKAKYEELNK